MFEVGDLVKVKNPSVEEQGEMLSSETINLLKTVDFTGTITKVEDELFFVGFTDEKLGWVTQVFKEEEIEEVE